MQGVTIAARHRSFLRAIHVPHMQMQLNCSRQHLADPLAVKLQITNLSSTVLLLLRSWCLGCYDEFLT